MSHEETDAGTGMKYVTLSEAKVSRTVHLCDLTMVDVDDAGHVVGVEFINDQRVLIKDCYLIAEPGR